jgi:hypothetical protein
MGGSEMEPSQTRAAVDGHRGNAGTETRVHAIEHLKAKVYNLQENEREKNNGHGSLTAQSFARDVTVTWHFIDRDYGRVGPRNVNVFECHYARRQVQGRAGGEEAGLAE